MITQRDTQQGQDGGGQAGQGPGQGARGPGAPFQPLLPPPQRPRGPKSHLWILISAVVVVVLLASTLGTILLVRQAQHPGTGSQITTTPTTSSATTPGSSPGMRNTSTPGNTQTPAPGQTPTSQPGSPVTSTAYWDTVLGTHSGGNAVESVKIGPLMGNSSQQALIGVRYTRAGAKLDVYVFTNITAKKPTQIFHLAGLLKGQTQISGYNTILTMEVDTHSVLNTSKAMSAMTPDLFREFEWSSQVNTFAQVAFPGLFPDLTRYQAEMDQALVNQGQNAWKNDPTSVSKSLVTTFFGWKHPLITHVLSGGGARDVDATVQVQEVLAQQGSQITGPKVTVTLSRLEGQTRNIWIAIGAQDGTVITLTNLQARSVITSPVTLKGAGDAFENTIGMAFVLDHLTKPVGQALLEGTSGSGMGYLPYSVQVSYHLSFQQGRQEGIVEIRQTPPIGDGSIILVKVLLNPSA